MLAYYYYWQAKKRLESSAETLEMMGPVIPPMLQAQHEMIRLEMEYYREASWFFTKGLLTFVVAFVIMYVLYVNGVFNV